LEAASLANRIRARSSV